MTGSAPPPAAGAAPLLGHAGHLLRDPLGFFCRMRENGEVVTIKLGPKRLYVVCAPNLVGELLLRNGQSLHVGGRLWDTLTVLLGEGLATSNGDKHRRQRRTTQAAFTAERIASYARSSRMKPAP